MKRPLNSKSVNSSFFPIDIANFCNRYTTIIYPNINIFASILIKIFHIVKALNRYHQSIMEQEKINYQISSKNPTAVFEQPATNGSQDFIRKQPLLALSGLGAVVGSVSTLLRKLKRIAPTNLINLPTMNIKRVPKYMKSNYIKYPAIFIILLASVKKCRSIMNY